MIDETGEEFYIQYGGEIIPTKPVLITEKSSNDKIELTIEARNSHEFKKAVKGLKKKYPSLDAEKALNTFQKKEESLSGLIHFRLKIGGENAFKSITKTALNFFLYMNGEKDQVTEAIDYLKGNNHNERTAFYYPHQKIYNPEKSEVSHLICICGNSSQNLLYAYIELFNIYCFIVLLNDNYCGKDLKETYLFDVIELKEIGVKCDLNFTKNELLECYSIKTSLPYKEIKDRFDRVVHIAMNRQYKKLQSDQIDYAIEKVLGSQPDGKPISKDIINKLANQIAENILPSMIKHLDKDLPKT